MSDTFDRAISPGGAPLYPPIDPEAAKSTLELRVRFAETDLMGIVHHANYLLYFEAGRVDWLRRRGVAYTDWASRGIHLPVVEAHAHYKSPARFDDLLVVETSLVELRSVSLRYGYRILRDGAVIADGYTRLGCIDANHKLLKLSDEMRAILLSAERGA